MEQENFQPDGGFNNKNYFNRVTALSKYTAMALFIALPFIGGWIGYNYMPEKVVEIQNVVVKDAAQVPVDTADTISDWKELYRDVPDPDLRNGNSYNYTLKYPSTWVDPRSLNMEVKDQYNREIILQTPNVGEKTALCTITQTVYLNSRNVDAISWWMKEGNEFRGTEVEPAQNILVSGRPAIKYVDTAPDNDVVRTSVYTTADSVTPIKMLAFEFTCTGKRDLAQEKVFEDIVSTLVIGLK